MADDPDELYALPLEEFTAARDDLAKRLRAEKRREEADAVKALRRPSIAAWAINQAVRRHGADELLSAGEELRTAYESLLAGGDRDEARAAADAEREAVRALTRHAVDALGDRASEATTEKIRTTLHAASTDDDLRERLAAGRLEKEVEAGSSGFPLSAAASFGGSRGKSGGSAAAGKAAGGKSAAAKSAAGKSASGRSTSGRSTSGRSASGRSASGRSASGRSASGRASSEDTSRAKSGRSASGGSGRATSGRATPGRSQAERRRAAAAERARKAAERAAEAHEEAEARADRARAALAEAEEASRKARAMVEELEAQERSARRAVKEAEAEAERRKTEARRALKDAEARA